MLNCIVSIILICQKLCIEEAALGPLGSWFERLWCHNQHIVYFIFNSQVSLLTMFSPCLPARGSPRWLTKKKKQIQKGSSKSGGLNYCLPSLSLKVQFVSPSVWPLQAGQFPAQADDFYAFSDCCGSRHSRCTEKDCCWITPSVLSSASYSRERDAAVGIQSLLVLPFSFSLLLHQSLVSVLTVR